MEQLSELFSKIRQQKHFSPESLSQLKSLIKSNSVASLPLWKMSTSMTYILKAARFQTTLVAGFALTLFPYLMYQKYTQNPSSAQTILIATPLCCLVLCAPLFLYRRVSSKMLQQIVQEISKDKLILQKVRKGIIETDIKNMKVQYSGNRRVKDIEVQGKKFNIEGLGEWNSIQVFKHIVEKGEL